MAGEAAGRFLGIWRLSRDLVPSMHAVIQTGGVSSLRATARHYRRFPIVFLPSSVLDAVSSAVVLPLFVLLFGVSSGGELLLAQQIIVAPSALLCAALADVYHRRLVELARDRTGSLNAVVIRESGRLLLLAAIILGPIGLIAPYLAGPVFGAGWERVGALALVLAPSAVVGVAASTLSRALVVSRIPQLKYIADVLKLVVPTSAMVVAQRGGCSLTDTAAIYSAALALSQIVYLLIIAYAVKPEHQTE